MTTPEELAFQKSTVALNNIRHSINFFSDKAFAENLINDSNKSRRTDIGDGERTKFLLTALLDRIKTRPETFGTLVCILKETSGMDFIGEELQKNLEKVKAELTAQGISHHKYATPETVLSVCRNGGTAISSIGVPFMPSVAHFTKQREHWDSASPFASSDTPTLASQLQPETHRMAKLHNPATTVGAERETLPNHPSVSLVTGSQMKQEYLISPNASCGSQATKLQVPEPATLYARSNSQCSSDGDSDYTTPSQSLSESMAEKLFSNISRKTLCKECLSQKTQLLSSQAENRRLKAKLKVQDEATFDQAAALKEEVLQRELQCRALKETCDRAVHFIQELEEKNSTLEEKNSSLVQTVEAKERERQEAWRYYEVSTNLLLRNLSQQVCDNSTANSTCEEAGKLGRTDERQFRSQKVTEMLNSCSKLMLPPGIPTKKGGMSENWMPPPPTGGSL